MTLPEINRIFWLVCLLVCCAFYPLMAQVLPVSETKTFTLGVIPEPGATYFWKIFTDYTLTTEAPISDAQFIQGNQGPNVSVSIKKRGIFFYTVTAFSYQGCSNMKVGFLENKSPVTALAGADQIIGYCQGANLDASQSTGDISAYKWEMIDPDGILSSPSQKSTAFTISSTYRGSYPAKFRILLTVFDKIGNTDKDTVNVTIDQPSLADVNLSGNLQKDGSMVVDGTLSKGIGLQYNWSTQEGKIIGDSHQSQATLNGSGIYTLEVTDQYGCKSLKSFHFPLQLSNLTATDDYKMIFWDQINVSIPVLENDYDSDNNIDPGSVTIKDNRPDIIPNKDGTITYKNILNQPRVDQFTYQVCDSTGNCATAKVTVDIRDAGITPTEAFSPNGDGANDLLVFQGLENYPKSQLYVYTRGGQLVYQSTDYLNNWDGKMKNQLVPMGTYYYILKLGGTNRIIKGFVFINY